MIVFTLGDVGYKVDQKPEWNATQQSMSVNTDAICNFVFISHQLL